MEKTRSCSTFCEVLKVSRVLQELLSREPLALSVAHAGLLAQVGLELAVGVAAPTGGLFRVLQPVHICSDSLQSWAQGGGWPGVTREGSPTGKVLPASGPSSLWLS